MSTIDEIFATISEEDVSANIDELLVIDQTTRQISLPSSELIFGVENDGRSERKYFQCPRVVGNDIDITSCFIRINYRNANGEVDSHLVEDVTVKGDMVLFSWELHEKVTKYKGNVQFLVCAYRADKVEWHTTLATGLVLEGLEPDVDGAVAETGDLVAQLLTMVASQTEAVKAEGAAQIAAVKASAKATEAEILDEIEAKGTNTLASIPNDYTALGEAVGALERMAAPGIICEAEGTSIVVADASNSPVQNLRIFGRSTQDGTPTPDNPVEIKSVENPVVAVAGKNLLPSRGSYSNNGITYTVNDDGSITMNGTATASSILMFTNKDGGHTHLIPAGEYIFSGVPGASKDKYYLTGFDSKDTDTKRIEVFGEDKTVVLESGYLYKMRLVVLVGVTINNVTMYPMIRPTSAKDTTYESYSGKTLNLTHTLHGIPVTSDGNYTDSNGQQWICDEIDLERGVYVSRTKLFTLGELKANTWYTWGVNYSTEGITGFYHFFDDDVTTVTVLSNMGEYSIKAWGGVGVGVGIGTSADGDYLIVSLPNEVLTDTSTNAKAVESFLSFIADTEAVILAAVAPIETPLTEAEIASFKALHTNKPITTVLNDQSAHTEISYVADTKLYIDRKIEAILG